MTYSITLAPPAARQLRKFDPQVRRRIQALSYSLANPDHQPQPNSWVARASGEFAPATTASRTRSKTINSWSWS